MLSVIKFDASVEQFTAKPREINDRILAGITAFETGYFPLHKIGIKCLFSLK